METNVVTETVTRQEWLDPAASAVQTAVDKAYESAGDAGHVIADALHGVWLGHPLHPGLTDIPLGAWTVAALFDGAEAAGKSSLAPGADAAVAIGLAGAIGSALTGLTDWHLLKEKPNRRTGMAHMLLNVTATGCYAASLILRRQDKRAAARLLGWLGYAIVGAGAYLGGTLVYENKIGEDHVDREAGPAEFVAVLPEEDLPENTLREVQTEGQKVLLVRREGKIEAISSICSHLGGPLVEGELKGNSVVCPWHGSRFCLTDGHVLNGPATFPQQRYETQVRGGQIEIRAIDKWEI